MVQISEHAFWAAQHIVVYKALNRATWACLEMIHLFDSCLQWHRAQQNQQGPCKAAWPCVMWLDRLARHSSRYILTIKAVVSNNYTLKALQMKAKHWILLNILHGQKMCNCNKHNCDCCNPSEHAWTAVQKNASTYIIAELTWHRGTPNYAALWSKSTSHYKPDMDLT